MNKILILLVIIITSMKLYAQPPQNGDYLKYDYLKDYEGTWVWTNNSDTVIVKMKKIIDTVNMPSGITFYADMLIGVHKFIKGSIVIEDFLADFDTLNYAHSKNNSISGCGDKKGFFCLGSIDDRLKKKYNEMKITYLDNTPPQIIMKIWEPEGVYDAATHIGGITLPVNITLIKQ